MPKRKSKNKLEPVKPKWLKASLELEAEVGDDRDAYLVDEEELAELFEEDEPDELDLDDPSPYADEPDDRDHEHETEEPPMTWDEDEGRFV